MLVTWIHGFENRAVFTKTKDNGPVTNTDQFLRKQNMVLWQWVFSHFYGFIDQFLAVLKTATVAVSIPACI
jgi:hypothetical protein